LLVQLLHDLDFVQCHSDLALFIYKYGRCIILIWVDDTRVFTTADVMEAVCDEILSLFTGRSEGYIGHVLGMDILSDRKARIVTITHRLKISDLLSANSMQGCRTFPTSLVRKETLKSMQCYPYQESAAVSEHQRYMKVVKVVGGIQYIALVTRPDIAFAACSLPGIRLHRLRYTCWLRSML